MSYRIALIVLLASPALLRADSFDRYINTILGKVPKAEGVKELKQLSFEQILENNQLLPDAPGALVVVQTNEGRSAKLLLQAARQKVKTKDGTTTIPIILIERHTTYRPGTDQTIHAKGERTCLYDGFLFSLDLGQVVPAKLGGDVRFVVKDDAAYIEPLGNAKVYLLTKQLPEAAAKKTGKFVIGQTFEPKYFTGKFKLQDDGRRSGVITLKVDKDGEVAGTYVSDRDGRKYEVMGKIKRPKYSIEFKIKFPRTDQVFKGWMFTGNGKLITGWSTLEDREAGFQATRIEE